MEILTFLGEHFIDVLFSLVSAGLLYLCRKIWKDKEEYKKIVDKNKKEDLTNTIASVLDKKLAPINKTINTFSEDLKTLKEEVQQIANKEKEDVSLFLDSEKTRLVDSCQEYLERGYITSEEYQRLAHLYDNYQSLGGNGIAKKNYERVKNLPIKG